MSSTSAVKKPTAADHPSASHVDRFPFDTLLRKHHFRIWRRQKNAEAIWLMGRVEMRERDALSRIDDKERADTEYLEAIGHDAEFLDLGPT